MLYILFMGWEESLFFRCIVSVIGSLWGYLGIIIPPPDGIRKGNAAGGSLIF